MLFISYVLRFKYLFGFCVFDFEVYVGYEEVGYEVEIGLFLLRCIRRVSKGRGRDLGKGSRVVFFKCFFVFVRRRSFCLGME